MDFQTQLSNVLDKYSDNQLISYYSLSDLRKLYMKFYGTSPRTNMDKIELISSLRMRLRVIARGNAFNKMN